MQAVVVQCIPAASPANMDSYSDLILSEEPRKMKSRPSVSQESSSKEYEMKDMAYIQYLPLYKAVDIGDLEATLKFLKEHPDGLTDC